MPGSFALHHGIPSTLVEPQFSDRCIELQTMGALGDRRRPQECQGMTTLPTDVIETLWEDGEFVLSRRVSNDEHVSLLVSTPASAPPTLETVTRLHHAYALRDELDSAWAARPVTLELWDQSSALLMEDSGGEVLAPRSTRFLPHSIAS
jgi:hypothetical protein